MLRTIFTNVNDTMDVEAGQREISGGMGKYSMARAPDGLVGDGAHHVGEAVLVSAVLLCGEGCCPS